MVGCEKAEILINKLRREFKGRDRVPVLELANSNDVDIMQFGHLLFEKAYRTYCAKQWDVPVESLDTSIMNRVPMAMSYDERYMNKDFQYLPSDGYEKLFKIILNTDANEHLNLDIEKKIITFDNDEVEILVYTGAVDELFNLKYGELPYRSLDITYEWFDKERVYPEEIISFPQADGYTRKTEYKFMMQDIKNCKGTIVATEYPKKYVKGKSIAPFYPVITDENKAKYKKYVEEANKFGNIFLCGRLADFKYYNMDDCILHAFDVFKAIKEKLEE